MTILDRLRAHKGGLVQIKTQLYWYGGRGWDGVPGRVCLLLDAAVAVPLAAYFVTTLGAVAASAAATVGARAGALLLIDGQPRWVRVVAKDIELLDGGDR